MYCLTTILRTRPLLAALVMLLAGVRCRREGVVHTRVVKVGEPTSAMGRPLAPSPAGDPMAGGEPAMAGGQVPLPPAPSQGEKLAWTLPKGWTEVKGAGMRFATLQPPMKGKSEVSVIRLVGDSGGELANVNRWRGQIGLGPVDGDALSKLRTSVTSKAGPIALYDFTSEGQTKTRMVVGMLVDTTSSWFLKLNGDEETVAAARADFVNYLGTLRFE